jgi:hypothetical protein
MSAFVAEIHGLPASSLQIVLKYCGNAVLPVLCGMVALVTHHLIGLPRFAPGPVIRSRDFAISTDYRSVLDPCIVNRLRIGAADSMALSICYWTNYTQNKNKLTRTSENVVNMQ